MLVNGRLLHKNNLGNSTRNKITGGSCGTLRTRYRIPPNLIKELIPKPENISLYTQKYNKEY